MYRKKVLVISNNCFSQSNSNGRTLGNLFNGWPKDDLAQFCISSRDPNWTLCDNYYRLEDRDVLKSFIKLRKAVGKKLDYQEYIDAESKETHFGKKTLGKVLLRELIWQNKRWKSNSLIHWLDQFNPDIVLLQFGDSMFMLDIAYTISKERNIPLVVFNTEGYYFFSRNWHYNTIWDNWLFKFFHRIYRKKVENLMSITKYCIYINEKLKEDYDRVFNCNSSVIYCSSTIPKSDVPLFVGSIPRISYLGNLGLDRDSALIEVGQVLNEINPSYKIDIYGKTDECMRNRFTHALGVDYKGLISYHEVEQVIKNSDILFHIETEKGYIDRQLQYAFTTKIADSLSSGRCFIVYAPRELACYKYIQKLECGWIASNKDELKKVIMMVLSDDMARQKVIKNALTVAEKNHNSNTNAMKFKEILYSVV